MFSMFMDLIPFLKDRRLVFHLKQSGFSSKKDYGREEIEIQWANKAQRTLHGLEPMKTAGVSSKKIYEDLSLPAEKDKKRAEFARFVSACLFRLTLVKVTSLCISGHELYDIFFVSFLGFKNCILSRVILNQL